MRGAMILQVNLEILSGQHRGFATMRTCYWEPTAFRVVSAERIENEFFITVTAGDQSLGALSQLVLAEMSPLHLHAALVFAIKRLVTACPRVFLQTLCFYNYFLEPVILERISDRSKLLKKKNCQKESVLFNRINFPKLRIFKIIASLKINRSVD